MKMKVSEADYKVGKKLVRVDIEMLRTRFRKGNGSFLKIAHFSPQTEADTLTITKVTKKNGHVSLTVKKGFHDRVVEEMESKYEPLEVDAGEMYFFTPNGDLVETTGGKWIQMKGWLKGKKSGPYSSKDDERNFVVCGDFETLDGDDWDIESLDITANPLNYIEIRPSIYLWVLE